jgi:Uma2 family endonuclease
MSGDMPVGRWKLNLEVFQAFRDDRPKEEKWELIDGTPVMMPPPTLVHQRISRALLELLNARLRTAKPEWRADMEIGLVISEDDGYNPEPDVTVIDFDVSPDEIYASKFYFVAEVLSPNDKPPVLAAKQPALGSFLFTRIGSGPCSTSESRIGRSTGWTSPRTA